MAFKTINGVVTKTRNKETGCASGSWLTEQHGNRSKIIVADIISGKYEGAKQLMKLKTALKAPHKYLMKRFADKEDIAKVVGDAKY